MGLKQGTDLHPFGNIFFLVINTLLIQFILKNSPFIKLAKETGFFLFDQFTFSCQQQALSGTATISPHQSTSSQLDSTIPAVNQNQYIGQLIAFNGRQYGPTCGP